MCPACGCWGRSRCNAVWACRGCCHLTLGSSSEQHSNWRRCKWLSCAVMWHWVTPGQVTSTLPTSSASAGRKNGLLAPINVCNIHTFAYVTDGSSPWSDLTGTWTFGVYRAFVSVRLQNHVIFCGTSWLRLTSQSIIEAKEWAWEPEIKLTDQK